MEDGQDTEDAVLASFDIAEDVAEDVDAVEDDDFVSVDKSFVIEPGTAFQIHIPLLLIDFAWILDC